VMHIRKRKGQILTLRLPFPLLGWFIGRTPYLSGGKCGSKTGDEGGERPPLALIRASNQRDRKKRRLRCDVGEGSAFPSFSRGENANETEGGRDEEG